MIAGLASGLPDRERLETALEARAAGPDGVAPALTRDPTRCFEPVVVEARE
jgi:hypothetical protein